MAPKRDRLIEYIDEMEKDVQVDELSVKEVQMKLPALKHKWVGRLMRHKAIISGLQRKKEAMKKEAAEKMKESTMYNMSDVALDKLIEKQDSVMELNTEISEHRLVIEFLEKSERIFSSFTFDIKNLVEVMKLETF
jgi:hypothetical protein